MNGKYILIGLLGTLATIILIVISGLVAVKLGLKNEDAFQVLASAIGSLGALATALAIKLSSMGDEE